MHIPNLTDKFAQRVAANKVPNVLAGPILRHVDRGSVTVWIALRVNKRVNLQVLATPGNTILAQSGLKDPVKIGPQLFVAAVTAHGTFVPGTFYAYDIKFGGTAESPGDAGLFDAGYLFTPDRPKIPEALVGYSNFNRPSFLLPAATPVQLRVVHGSCRKPQGEAIDTLATLDDIMRTKQDNLLERPQQLFLTGDQIYADEVASVMLAMILDIAPVLLGTDETLPGLPPITEGGTTNPNPKLADFGVDGRKPIVEKAGFTTGAGHNHVLGVGEYVVLYLLYYSDALWPAAFPEYQEVFPSPNDPPTEKGSSELTWSGKAYVLPRPPIEGFIKALLKVRRALANIPTYMVIDDHDVTDDFLMNGEVCRQVFGTTDAGLRDRVGSRVIQNALAAFALCQGWGNVGEPTPAPTTPPAPGDARPAVTALAAWVSAKYPASGATFDALADAVGIPTKALVPPAQDATSWSRLTKPANAVKWNFYLAWDAHELFALDCRTLRAYPNDRLQSPAIIDETVQQQQITGAPKTITFVITPKSIITMPYLEAVQAPPLSRDKTFSREAETWRFDPTSLEFLLSLLAVRGDRKRRVVLLSGDTHFSFVYRTQYWAARPLADPTGGTAAAAMALFTSSAFKNETSHYDGFFGDMRTTRYHQVKGFAPWASSFLPNARVMMALSWIATPQDGGNVAVGREREVGGGGPGNPPVTTNTDFTVPRSRKILSEQDFRSVVISGGSTTTITSLTRTPDSIAKHSFQRAQVNAPSPGTSIPSAPPSGGPRAKTFVDGLGNHREYFDKTGPGSEIVGVNNLGLIRFEQQVGTTDPDGLRAIQELWWRSGQAQELYDADANDALVAATARSIYVVPLAIEAQPDPLQFIGG